MHSFEVKCINLAWRTRCHPELFSNTFRSLWRLFTDNYLIAGHRDCVTSIPLRVPHVVEERLKQQQRAGPASVRVVLIGDILCYCSISWVPSCSMMPWSRHSWWGCPCASSHAAVTWAVALTGWQIWVTGERRSRRSGRTACPLAAELRSVCVWIAV